MVIHHEQSNVTNIHRIETHEEGQQPIRRLIAFSFKEQKRQKDALGRAQQKRHREDVEG